MATLTEFVGEIIDDISKARNYADFSAAALSEQYFADPFIKALPVPHYTIDEVEVDVPVIVVGLSTNKDSYKRLKDNIAQTITQKLPVLLIRAFTKNYEKQIESSGKTEEKTRSAENLLNAELNKKQTDNELIDDKIIEMPTYIQEHLVNYSNEASDKLVKYINKYICNYNYQVLKLLDLTDDFSDKLKRVLEKGARKLHPDAKFILNKNYFENSIKYISSVMFFEFKKLMQLDDGVEINPCTAQMNEFSSKVDCLMHIKLKIREQDLNLLTEEKDGKQKRFLSLT